MIGHLGGSNLYAYVENDPLNLTDPTGHLPQLAGWLASGGYGGIVGGVAGFITGAQSKDPWGAVKGLGAGFVAGFATGLALQPRLAGKVGHTAALAIVGGTVSAGTQIVANVVNREAPGTNFSVGAVGGAMLGGVGGSVLGRLVGNWAGGATGVTIGSGTRTLSYATAPTSRATANAVARVVEGSVVGGAEVLGHWFEDDWHRHSAPRAATGGSRK